MVSGNGEEKNGIWRSVEKKVVSGEGVGLMWFSLDIYKEREQKMWYMRYLGKGREKGGI